MTMKYSTNTYAACQQKMAHVTSGTNRSSGVSPMLYGLRRAALRCTSLYRFQTERTGLLPDRIRIETTGCFSYYAQTCAVGSSYF